MKRTSRCVGALVLVGAFSLTAVGTSSAHSTPPVDEQWEAISLAPPEHNEAIVTGSEDLSHLVVYSTGGQGDSSLRALKDGEPIRTATIGEEIFIDVNNKGVIVGSVWTPDGSPAAVFRGQEEPEILRSVEGTTNCNALSINDNNEVIGACFLPHPDKKPFPVYWPTPESEPVVLELAENQKLEGEVMLIDNDGNLAGIAYEGETPQITRTVVWNTDGTVRATAETPKPGDHVHLSGLTHGTLFGWLRNGHGRDDSHAAGIPIWDAKTGKLSLLEAEGAEKVLTVNANGVFGGVGSGDTPRLWKDGKVTAELPGLNGETNQKGQVDIVSDDARTVAGVVGGDAAGIAKGHAVLWKLK